MAAQGRRVDDRRHLFLSDIDDPALLERAERVIGALEAIYHERYGRRPVGMPREAIVLFSSEDDYRHFQAGDRRLAGLTASTGLAGSGIVATFRGPRRDDELLGTLVHELVHLLNRRAIGPALPSWLDEGLADDLGASRIDPDGRLSPGTWSRTLDAHENEIRIAGGEAALRDLADVFGPDGSAPGRLDLGATLALEWEDFVAEPGAELHYAAAAAFIRMLLAAPAKSTVFRGWLAQVSEGGSPAAEELRRALDRPWEELDHELALWTRGELARLPPLRPAGGPAGACLASPAARSRGSDIFRQVPVAKAVAGVNFRDGSLAPNGAERPRQQGDGPTRELASAGVALWRERCKGLGRA